MPSPLTVNALEVKATVLQSFGPRSVKVIVPPARAPAVVGLMTGVPGWFAVPERLAVSVTGCPRSTELAPAAVPKVGVTGVTLKHSLVLVEPAAGSLEAGTPTLGSPE